MPHSAGRSLKGVGARQVHNSRKWVKDLYQETSHALVIHQILVVNLADESWTEYLMDRVKVPSRRHVVGPPLGSFEFDNLTEYEANQEPLRAVRAF
jgi:hypothetical protein